MSGDGVKKDNLPFLFAPAEKQELLTDGASVQSSESETDKDQSNLQKIFRELFS